MSLIPKVIYQSWKTKNLSEKMTEAVNKVKELNPEYKYELWDDNDCRQFLLEHFGINYANAFDILIPGAFKCDFWRYAKLYIDGGVYMDIDMVPLVPFNQMIDNNDEFVSIVDMENTFSHPCAIYQAFIACKPKHPILLYTLQLTFANIVTRRKDTFESLSVTGPVVMGLGLNLYWNKDKTHERIKPGIYDKIKLYKMDGNFTYDLQNNKIINNKFEGYNRGIFDYTTSEYYKDDPRSNLRKKIKYIVIVILVIAIIGILLSIIFRRKWKKCQESCGSSE
jgi:hypothetical protein